MFQEELNISSALAWLVAMMDVLIDSGVDLEESQDDEFMVAVNLSKHVQSITSVGGNSC